MTTYYFDMPALTNSKKRVPVTINGVNVFVLEQFFINSWQKILTGIMPGFITNIQVRRKEEVMAKTIDTVEIFGRPRWTLFDLNKQSTYLLKDQSMVKSHPRASVSIDGLEYKIKKDFGSKETKVWLNDEVIIIMSYDKALPPRSYRIDFFVDHLNEALFVSLLYTYDLGV